MNHPLSDMMMSSMGKIRDMIDAALLQKDTWQGKKCDYLGGKAVRKFMTKD